MVKTYRKNDVIRTHGILRNGVTLCGLVPDGKISVIPVSSWKTATSFKLCANCDKSLRARLRENPGEPLERPVKPDARYQREVAL